MTLMNATYFANYDDYDGFDEIECRVDLDKMEVESFGEVKSCRWFDNSGAMCVSETIQLEDGREFEAIKFDEYEDCVTYGNDQDMENAFDNGEIILFDSDELEKVMDEFEAAN